MVIIHKYSYSTNIEIPLRTKQTLTFLSSPTRIPSYTFLPPFRLIKNYECVILDNFSNNIEENLFFSIINQIIQDNQYFLLNSRLPIKDIEVKLNDLKSRFQSFTELGIDLPTDDLLRVILTKCFSDIQIKVDIKLLEYILKNIERSYEKVFRFFKEIDNESLSSGKSINIKLIKKVLTNE